MATTKTRLTALETKAAPALASQWFRKGMAEPENEGEVLDTFCMFAEYGVLVPLDRKTQAAMEDYQARRKEQKEAEERTWPEVAPEDEEDELFLCYFDGATSICEAFGFIPSEFIAPDGREKMGDLLRGQAFKLREDTEEWDTTELLAFARALIHFVVKVKKTECINDIPISELRQFVKDWEPI